MYDYKYIQYYTLYQYIKFYIYFLMTISNQNGIC